MHVGTVGAAWAVILRSLQYLGGFDMTKILVVCLVVVIGLAVLAQMARATAAPAKGEQSVDPKEALALIQKNKGNPSFVVLDVRTPEEFKEGHIEGAINVDYNSGGFPTGLKELDKSKTYLTYCRSGNRVKGAVKMMRELGFENIIRLNGDMIRWKSEKMPVVK
jgi:rhodanese-related sulfurtransferase